MSSSITVAFFWRYLGELFNRDSSVVGGSVRRLRVEEGGRCSLLHAGRFAGSKPERALSWPFKAGLLPWQHASVSTLIPIHQTIYEHVMGGEVGTRLEKKTHAVQRKEEISYTGAARFPAEKP